MPAHGHRWIAALTVAIAAGCGDRVPAPTEHEPDVGVLDLDGQRISLPELLSNPVTVLIFTRTDCPVANRLAPEIARLNRRFDPKGVDFWMVYVDPRESPDAIRNHQKEYRMPERVVRDPAHSLVAHCDVLATPAAVVFVPSGEIAYRGRINDLYLQPGQPRAEATTHDLADALDAVLAGRPVAVPRTRAVGCPIADLKD